MSNQTQGKIKELISDLDKSTLMVLVNYIYFKGGRGHCLGVEGEELGGVTCVLYAACCKVGLGSLAEMGV